MNKIYIFLIFLMLFGCSGFNHSKYISSEKQKIVDEIIRKVAIELKRETGLQPCGTGGQLMDQVKMLALSFDYQGPITTEEARALLIKSVDALVSAVNANERIRPYLDHYPFEPKNVEIMIFLKGSDHPDMPLGKLSLVSSIYGVFSYKIDNPETKLFDTIYQETYTEARKQIVEDCDSFSLI